MELIGKYGDTVFDERQVSFTLGEGSEHNIIEGIERALEKFKKREKSKLIIKSKYAFGEGSAEYNIPSDATVEYIVTLKSFEKVSRVEINDNCFIYSFVFV